MGKPVNSSVKRSETIAINQKINKRVFKGFKDVCKYRGYSMNVMLETFMHQYACGRFKFLDEDIDRWKRDTEEFDVLSTPINREVYTEFKSTCKNNGHFVKYVMTAFMDALSNTDLILEYADPSVGSLIDTHLVQIIRIPTNEGTPANIDLPKGFMRCPFCGKHIEALADNWCLIKPHNSLNKYLACKNCEGANGEYKY